jgi:hypothetical protein
MPEDIEEPVVRRTLSEAAARQLANATKTRAQWSGITPRWLVSFLPWSPVEAGIYRLNRVRETVALADSDVACSPRRDTDTDLPETFSTVLDVQTRVSDLYSHPYDQIQEQVRLLVEKVKEKQESELINNPDYGLLANAAPSMRIAARAGTPTPDDFDELIARVWKEPAFFLAHPRAIAAFGRECTRRGVPPPTVTLFGSPFLTWRGLPIVPSDKLYIDDAGTTNILLMRTGEQKQGVVGLFQPGIPGEVAPSLSVRFMGINRKAVASYLISLYCSAAILTHDALGVLEGIDVGKYHQYPFTYA